MPASIDQAVRQAPGLKLGDCIYVRPDHGRIDPRVHWKRFSLKWNRTGDLGLNREDAHLRLVPCVLKLSTV